MKRLFVFVLLMMMTLSLCACSESAESESMPTPTPQATKEPKLTKEEALSILSDYLDLHSSEFIDKLVEETPNSKVVSAKYASVASVTDGCGMIYSRSEDFGFTLKGNFFGYDQYGNLVGQYNFERAAVVESDGSVRLASSVTIRKS